MNQAFYDKVRQLTPPTMKGRYTDDDCMFVLNDIGTAIKEEDNALREGKMSSGVHYSEMLPIEEPPSADYLQLYHQTLKDSAFQMAQYVADVAEMILESRGEQAIIVSLARAGTPVGVLIKRYVKFQYGIDLPHYSISIIRGKGIDENALLYIMNKHDTQNLVFVDGWTGKGAIGKVLAGSIEAFNQKYDVKLSNELAVLADPAHSAEIYGTREDFFLPSACLNSIVSGLVSRTVHRDDLVGEHGYHGAKYYEEWEEKDLSIGFVDEVSSFFPHVQCRQVKKEAVTMQGWQEIEQIQKEFGIVNINKIKPSIGETTRVLLRRVPWKILIKELDNPSLKHIQILAKEKGVAIEHYPDMSYACIGLIKE